MLDSFHELFKYSHSLYVTLEKINIQKPGALCILPILNWIFAALN